MYWKVGFNFRILWPFRNSQKLHLQSSYVRSLFDAIAHRYDLLNHLLSGGVDVYWRYRAIEHLRKIRPKRILDVATGTADFAIASLRLNPREVIGVDVAENMLEVGRRKIAKRGVTSVISLRAAEAERLPFEDGGFDAAIVAFGARNFAELDLGLSEMHRVLRSGGSILVLEFSRPARFPLKQLYLLYFLHVLPHIGRLLSGHKEAYSYLPETVMKFPEGDDFLSLLERSGFVNTRQTRVTGGIVSIYIGSKHELGNGNS